ncbi:MAG: hypothetical protein EOO75_13500, partial [Myxococcales bacterium]
MSERTGVLLSAHGTVENLDELPAFLARIRRGRPVPDELLHETRRRYELIGGSPLLRTAREVAGLLSTELSMPVFIGMRLSEPSLDQAITEARDAGVTRLVSVPLAPQSVQIYHEAAREAAARVAKPPTLIEVPTWGASGSEMSRVTPALRACL